MTTNGAVSFVEHFEGLEDPRILRGRLHKIGDIVAIAVCAVISGADGWVHVELWAQSKEQWLRTFLDLPHGIPSHDTFGRVFALLNPDAFRACFTAWTGALAKVLPGQRAIDGKTLRGSVNRANNTSPIHMVSAWATGQELVIAQVKTDEKSNEIEAIPRLLELLDLNGCTVTTDAMGCQKEIATKIVEGGGNYVLALKGNQPGTLKAATEAMEAAVWEQPGTKRARTTETKDAAHGRVEKRIYACIAAPACAELAAWPRLKSVILVERERHAGGKTSLENTYYLSSLEPDAQIHSRLIRGHWSIENQLHWTLDVQFNEDHSRIRIGDAPENFAILRHICLNLLKQERTSKLGIASKRRKAGWDHDYLLKVLGA